MTTIENISNHEFRLPGGTAVTHSDGGAMIRYTILTSRRAEYDSREALLSYFAARVDFYVKHGFVPLGPPSESGGAISQALWHPGEVVDKDV